jgi:hypothetical protein
MPNEALPLLRVTGVPEHFNYPWNLAIKEKRFEAAGLRVEVNCIKKACQTFMMLSYT